MFDDTGSTGPLDSQYEVDYPPADPDDADDDEGDNLSEVWDN
jgi:hypothetical protein